MAKKSSSGNVVKSIEKTSAQGKSRNTNLAATPNRGKLRRYRGQGKK